MARKKKSPGTLVSSLEKLSDKATSWIGSTESIITHTLFFIGMFMLVLFGVSFSMVLLILTTILSLEAIYLAIFIQMSINRNTTQLAGVEKDIEEISEDVEDIQKDVDEIQEDMEEMSEDVEEIQEDIEEIDEEKVNEERLATIENRLADLLKEIQNFKK